MTPQQYFAYGIDLTRVNPPHITDFSQVALVNYTLGIQLGKVGGSGGVGFKNKRDARSGAQQVRSWWFGWGQGSRMWGFDCGFR